jgi:hypothetical protein
VADTGIISPETSAATADLTVIAFTLDDEALRREYDDFFESCSDAFIQQSTSWAEVVADIGPDTPIFLACRRDGQMVAGLPLYLYRNRLGNILTSVPQAGPMGGVFVHESLDRSEVEACYAALIGRAEELAAEHECIAMSVITSPLREDLPLYERYLQPTQIFENFTQLVVMEDVIEDGKVSFRDYNRSSNLRRNLRTAHAAGFTLAWAQSIEEFEEWYRIHEQRHREIGVEPISHDMLRSMFTLLGERDKARLLLVRDGDTLASGILFIGHRQIMDVYMPSVDSAYMDRAPNFLGTEYSLLWAWEHGVRYYNFQSCSSRSSGVYGYKKQWASRDLPYYHLTKLYCDPSVIQEIGIDGLRNGYRGHYVVPFAAFESGFQQRHFTK